jgi:hypothetical protein
MLKELNRDQAQFVAVLSRAARGSVIVPSPACRKPI